MLYDLDLDDAAKLRILGVFLTQCTG